jgi:hypothetical protein
MKRRSLLMLSLLAIPGRLFAQDTARRSRSSTSRQVSVEENEPPTTKARRPRQVEDAGVRDTGTEPDHSDAVPANFPEQAGFVWKTFPIAEYSALDPNQSSPQTAIIDWIFRRTDPAPWHGDKIAVLCASRTQIRAYNSPKVIEQVAEVVERFTDAYADILSIRVRFVAATDSRWRYAVHQRLTPIGSGPQGQQIWQTSVADAEMVMSQMQVWQGFRLLEDHKYEMVNGLTLKVSHTEPRPFTAGVQRENAVGLGFQPKTEKLEEGIVLRFSPLLSYEGDGYDAAIELSTNVVRKLHATKVLAAREVGPGELSIDVPEVSETRLNKPIKNLPLGQTLVISAGIQPGVLQEKGGLFNMRIPGTVPTGTEILVIINVELANRKGRERSS